MRVVASCLLGVLIAGLTGVAAADPLKCQRSILKESVKLTRSRVKELQKCEDQKLNGKLAPGTDCTTEPGAAAKIAKAESKLQGRLDKACGGTDRVCGTADDEPPAGLGWPAICPEFQDQGCQNAIDGCDDIAMCLLCIDRAAVEQTRALTYDLLATTTNDDLRACQRTIGKETRRVFDARHNALRKCWDGRYKGKHANDCPDPGDGKAAAKIAQAESKARTKICRACGGDDRECGGGDDFSPATIGFPPECPDVGACDVPVPTLDDLADCLACVSEFDGTCALDAGIPSLTTYSLACANAPMLADVLLRIDGTPGPVDLDMGWTGFAHDLAAPWIGRLTLAGNDCTGDGAPTYGECTLSGPVVDDTDPSFGSSRCADQPWIECSIDLECTLAGATGPCQFFLGPPQPISVGGANSCVLNRFTGPITGTVDVEAGAMALTMPLRLDLHVLGGGDPCPRCIAGTCDGGPRDGSPCTVQGTSVQFGDDVSLDCPPGLNPIEIPITVPFATSTQTVTLSTASPSCTAGGFSSRRCFCDTCASATEVTCLSDADCPGATPGSCGGLRCLGLSNPGVPCMTPGIGDPACGTAPCGVPGNPSKPNACTDLTCQPIGGGAGECSNGPFNGFCTPGASYEGCLADSDCTFPGDTCAIGAQTCYLDNGLVGNAESAPGSPDPPVNGLMTPVLGSVFCVAPTNTVADSSRGLPGLARATAAVTVEIVP